MNLHKLSTALAVSATGAVLISVGISTATAEPAPLAPQLVWTPDPARDGLNAFEGVEDHDDADAGTRHIYVRDGAWRFDMHRRDRAGSDRQRQETKGMRQAGRMLTMRNGSTWRITYDMYMPSTLHGTSRFCHIFQLKKPGTGTGPLVTMSLRRSGGQEQIALRAFASGGDIGSTALAPWGIYRSIRSASSDIIDTYLLIRNMRAYEGT